MKLYYFNDTKNPVLLYRYNLEVVNFVKKLDKATGCMVQLDLPDGAIPFVKTWSGVVLVTYMENCCHKCGYMLTKDDSKYTCNGCLAEKCL